MTRDKYQHYIDWVANLIVATNEDARSYEQHVDAAAEMAPLVSALEATGADWRRDVNTAIHRQLVDRGLVESVGPTA
jgi:hypothetical protein